MTFSLAGMVPRPPWTCEVAEGAGRRRFSRQFTVSHGVVRQSATKHAADVTLHYVFSMTVPHPPRHPRHVVVIAWVDFSPRDAVIYEHLYYAME